MSPLNQMDNSEFTLSLLQHSTRLDGRQTYDYRNLTFDFGAELGQVQVNLGKTKCLAKVSGEITLPMASNPNEGIIKFNLDFSPMASPKFEQYHQSHHENHIAQLLETSLKKSKAVDVEGLCLVAGEKVWSIRVDIHVIDHDGNITDCACIAAITALMHYKRPEVTIQNDELIIHSVKEKHAVPLSIHHIPICTTFAFFDSAKYMVVDPTLEEEQAKESDMTIVMNVHREVCAISKAGVALEADQILRCANIASIKAIDLTKLIRDVVVCTVFIDYYSIPRAA